LITKDRELGTMKVEDCWYTEETGNPQQGQLPDGASAKRHMDVRDIHATAHASRGQPNQTSKKVEWHFPERPGSVRVKHPNFDIRMGAEGGEKIPRHAAHATPPLNAARRDVDHSNRVVRLWRHDAMIRLKPGRSAEVVMSDRFRCSNRLANHISVSSKCGPRLHSTFGLHIENRFMGTPLFTIRETFHRA